MTNPSEPLVGNVDFRKLVAECAQDPQFVTSLNAKSGDGGSPTLFGMATGYSREHAFRFNRRLVCATAD